MLEPQPLRGLLHQDILIFGELFVEDVFVRLWDVEDAVREFKFVGGEVAVEGEAKVVGIFWQVELRELADSLALEVAALEGGLAALDGGVAALEGGLAVLEGGLAVLEGGVAVLGGSLLLVLGHLAALNHCFGTLIFIQKIPDPAYLMHFFGKFGKSVPLGLVLALKLCLFN